MDYNYPVKIIFRKVIFFLWAISLVTVAHAESFIGFVYSVENGDNLKGILGKFTRNGIELKQNDTTIERIYKRNPEVKDWNKLTSKMEIKIYIEESKADLEKIRKYTKMAREAVEFKKKNALFVFYTASFGHFSEKSANGNTTIDFNQNSPITLGLMGRRTFLQNGHTLAASAYFSKLVSAKSNARNSEVSIPLELGANGYYEVPILRPKLSAYGGVDYEEFSTFNTNALVSSSTIELLRNKITYATFGVTAFGVIHDQFFMGKFSISQSVISSIDGPFEALEGQRYQFFLAYISKANYTIQMLYKIHVLQGTNELTIQRFGLGFGYRFF